MGSINDVSIRFPNGSRIVGLPGNETTVPECPRTSHWFVEEERKRSDQLYRRSICASLWMGKGRCFRELIEAAFGKDFARLDL